MFKMLLFCRSQIRRLIGQSVRKTIDKAKHLAHEVRLHGPAGNSGREAIKDGGEDDETTAKIKLRAGHKGPYEFEAVKQLQVNKIWIILLFKVFQFIELQ